jgi:hypothetical protein
MKPHFKLFGIMGLAIALILVCVSWFFLIGPLIHDNILNEFSQPFYAVQLPKETEYVDSLKKVGQQIGNGDHCDYLVATLLKTDLSKEVLESHYLKEYKGEGKIEFIWLSEANIYTSSKFDPLTIHTLKNWIEVKKDNSMGSVIVYVFEPGMTTSFDYRCS